MSVELHPILSAMRRNKVGALVIVAQTAITLAILCNSLFIIQQRLRLSDRPTGLQERTLLEARRRAYRDDRGLAIILATVSVVLLIVTAFGIIGVTSFWVSQRRRQIGIRRAMGATRTAILRYSQTENLMIASAGAALGILLALTLNYWMAGKFEMARLQIGYTLVAAALVMLLGQIAVLWPALRAASISPVVAIRNV
jgi:putative ABC transport system permease protein